MGTGDKRINKKNEAAVVRAEKEEAARRADFRGYVNVELTEDEKAEFDEWQATGAPVERLDKACSEGIQFGLKWEGKGKPHLASATDRTEGSVNGGLCVTCRASNPLLALYRLLFTLEVLSTYGSWELRQPLADPDRW